MRTPAPVIRFEGAGRFDLLGLRGRGSRRFQ
jgi:hypothetical protein